MTHRPMVTIGLLSYNASDTIDRALQSARNQQYENFEIVVVDDCSKDDSFEKIKSVADTDHRVRVFRNEKNRGVAFGRNEIARQARGEIICFFDDDDESNCHRLTAQVDALLASEGAYQSRFVACYASGERIYPNGYCKYLPAIGSRLMVPNGGSVADYLLYYHKVPGWFYGAGVPSCALMIRKNVLTDLGGFDENLRRVEDVDLAVRLAFMGGYFVGTKDTLYTQYATTGVDKSPDRNVQAEQILVAKNFQYLSGKKLFFYALNWPLLRYAHFSKNYPLFMRVLISLLCRYPIRTMRHLIQTGPRRIFHEKKIRGGLK